MGELVKLEQLQWGDKLSTMLNNMRGSQTLCDTAIVCRDNSTLRCHKCVVAASSTAMSKVLIDLETKKELTPGKEILVRTNIEKDIWEAVLQFMYTGIAIIKPERMTYLRRVAEKFCISELHDLCIEFERQETSKAAGEATIGDVLEQIVPQTSLNLVPPVANSVVDSSHRLPKVERPLAVRPTSMGMPIPEQFPAPPLTLSTPIFQGIDEAQMQNLMNISGSGLTSALLNSVNTDSICPQGIIPSGESAAINPGAGIAPPVTDIAGAVSAAETLPLDYSGLETISNSDGVFTASQTINNSLQGEMVYSHADMATATTSLDSFTSQAISEMLTSSVANTVSEMLNTPIPADKGIFGAANDNTAISVPNCVQAVVVPENGEDGIVGQPAVIAPAGYFPTSKSSQGSVAASSTFTNASMSTATSASSSISEKVLSNSGLPDVVPADQLNAAAFVNTLQDADKTAGFFTSIVDSLKNDNIVNGAGGTGSQTASEEGPSPSSSGENIRPHKKKENDVAGLSWKDKKQCRHCGQKFTSIRKLLIHGKSQHPGERMRVFYCEECDLDFENNQQLQMHIGYHNSVDSLENFICEHCGSTYSEVRKLEAHIDNVHREKELTCKLCGALFTRTVQLEDHLEKYCTSKYNIIPNSQGGTAAAESLSTEAQDSDSQSLSDYPGCTFQPLMTFRCDSCKQVFSSLSELAAHAQVHIPLGRVTPFSDVSSSHFSQVSDALHVNESETTCSIQDNIEDMEMLPNCELLSPTKLIGESPENDITNPFSLKSLGLLPLRSQNLKKWTGKHYPCNFCKKPFSSVVKKTLHQMIHLPPFRCNICGRRFEKQYLLKKHKYWYHSEFLYPCIFKCKYCPSLFSSENMLQFHTNTKHFHMVNMVKQNLAKVSSLPSVPLKLSVVGELSVGQHSILGAKCEPEISNKRAAEIAMDHSSHMNATDSCDSMNLLDNLNDNSMSGDNQQPKIPKPLKDIPIGGLVSTLPDSDNSDSNMVDSSNILPSEEDSENVDLPVSSPVDMIPVLDGATDIGTAEEMIVQSMEMTVPSGFDSVVSSDDPFIPPHAAYST